MILKCRVKCLLPPFLFLPTLQERYRSKKGQSRPVRDFDVPLPLWDQDPWPKSFLLNALPSLIKPTSPYHFQLNMKWQRGEKKKKKEKDQDNLFVPYPNHHWTSWCHGRLIASTVLKWNRIINVSSHKQLKAHSFCFVLEVSCDKFPMAAFSQVNCLVFL